MGKRNDPVEEIQNHMLDQALGKREATIPHQPKQMGDGNEKQTQQQGDTPLLSDWASI